MSLIYWMACCYVWPLVLGNSVGRCGYCGVRPHTPVDEPASGKAEPLAN